MGAFFVVALGGIIGAIEDPAFGVSFVIRFGEVDGGSGVLDLVFADDGDVFLVVALADVVSEGGIVGVAAAGVIGVIDE